MQQARIKLWTVDGPNRRRKEITGAIEPGQQVMISSALFRAKGQRLEQSLQRLTDEQLDLLEQLAATLPEPLDEVEGEDI